MRLATLENIFKDTTCIVGVGNYYRGDDAVGLYIVDTLAAKVVQSHVVIFNVEDVIESYVFAIAQSNCKNVLIIDAIEADAEEGTVVFGKLSDFVETGLDVSTHKLALRMSCKILEASGKDVYMLGIVIKHNDFGKGLSPIILDKVDSIVSMVQSSIMSNQKECVYEH
ncbi:MAG: hydrogenase maturation protease [Spirochaetota bacterium]